MSEQNVQVTQADITGLSEMLDRDIERDGRVASFMIRSGLLRDILDELQRHRTRAEPVCEGG